MLNKLRLIFWVMLACAPAWLAGLTNGGAQTKAPTSSVSSAAYYPAQGYATAAGGETLVILSSVPLRNSVRVFVGGLIIFPGSYTINGRIIRLATAPSRSKVVVVIWATNSVTPGGISLASQGPKPHMIPSKPPVGK